jgi:hypothetical protein
MREIFEMGADLVNSAATKGAMDKWRYQRDSARCASNWSKIHLPEKF